MTTNQPRRALSEDESPIRSAEARRQPPLNPPCLQQARQPSPPVLAVIT